MTRARHQLIDLNATSYYHVINRCVRRSFLCGDDPYSHKNYDHRRQWLVDRIKCLSCATYHASHNNVDEIQTINYT
jgi:hypothetical protein